MQREVVKLDYDVPAIVKLDFGEGVQVEGKFGVQWQYTLNDNTAVMWLPKSGRDALAQSGAQAGDSVQIVKSMRGKTTTFHAQVVSDAHAPAPAPAPTPIRNGAKIPQRAYYQPDPMASQAALAQHITRESKPEPAPAPPPPAVREVHPVTEQLTSCLKSAIDAAAAAQEHARERGLGVTFTSEDVRAIALSVYIGLQRSRNEVR